MLLHFTLTSRTKSLWHCCVVWNMDFFFFLQPWCNLMQILILSNIGFKWHSTHCYSNQAATPCQTLIITRVRGGSRRSTWLSTARLFSNEAPRFFSKLAEAFLIIKFDHNDCYCDSTAKQQQQLFCETKEVQAGIRFCKLHELQVGGGQNIMLASRQVKSWNATAENMGIYI